MNKASSNAPIREGADGLCTQCAHPWEAHRLCGHGSPPTEGWIECPVEACTCHGTWSLPEDVAAQARAMNSESTSLKPAVDAQRADGSWAGDPEVYNYKRMISEILNFILLLMVIYLIIKDGPIIYLLISPLVALFYSLIMFRFFSENSDIKAFLAFLLIFMLYFIVPLYNFFMEILLITWLFLCSASVFESIFNRIFIRENEQSQ